MILFARGSGERIRYYDAQGLPTEPKPGKHRVFVDLKECSLITMVLPPLKSKDRNRLICQKLPSYFPGSLEGKIWDSVSVGEETRVFLVSKEMKKNILKDCGFSSKIHSPGQAFPRQKGDFLCHFKSPLDSEFLIFKDGKLDYGLHIDETKNSVYLTEKYLKDGYDVHELNFPTDLPGLFIEKKRIVPIWLFGMIFISILFVLILFFSWRRSKKLEKELASLEQTKQELTLTPPSEYESLPWKEGWEILTVHRNEDVYSRLEFLYSVFQDRALILHLQLQGKQFYIQGKGKNALRILEDLTEESFVEKVNLHQIQRTEEGEIFKLSGTWK